MIKFFVNIFIFFVTSFLFSCQTDRNEVMAIGKKTIMPTQTGKNVTMLYSDSTILKIKLEAPQMLMYECKRTYDNFTKRSAS